ncbi:MAG: hypothetical protein SFY70_13525 [Bacteroidia bacterium]|nr:hypothetical protein [Bacteroidia bacterium]
MVWVPIAVAVSFCLVLYVWRATLAYGSVRRSLLLGVGLYALATIGITELLSAIGGVTRQNYLVAYGLLLVVVLAGCAVGWKRKGIVRPRLGPAPWFAYAGLGMLLGLTLLAGLLTPPNSTDFLTYHLPRVEHWLQNQTVQFYPTGDLRQVTIAPGYAYQLVVLRALGGYGWLFLPQWVCYGLLAVAASLLVQAHGGTGRGQLLGAGFALCIPIVAAQAPGTFNDLQVGAAIATTVWLLVLPMPWTLERGLWLGLAAGTALWLKSTAVFYFLPIGLWVAYNQLGNRRFWQVACVAVALGGFLNLGLWLRNLQAVGHPLGDAPALQPYTTQAQPTPATALSTYLRFQSAQLMVPGQPQINGWIAQLVALLHRPLGLSADDPRTTLADVGRYSTFSPTLDEPQVPNLTVYLAVLVATLWAVTRRKWYWVGYALVLQAVLLLMSLLLLWQPWATRFLGVWYVLYTPLVVTWFVGRRTRTQWLVGVVVWGFATLVALRCYPHRLLPGGSSVWRTDLENILAYRPEELNAYRQIADTLAKHRVTEVGLHLGFNTLTGPLWMLTQGTGTRYYPVGVRNESWAAAPAQNRYEPSRAWLVVAPPAFDSLARLGYRPCSDSASVRLYHKPS